MLLAPTAREWAQDAAVTGRWTLVKAQQWHAHHGWPVGGRFVPSTAINQIDLW